MKTIKYSISNKDDGQFGPKPIKFKDLSFEVFSEDFKTVANDTGYENCFFYVSMPNLEKKSVFKLSDAYLKSCITSTINDATFTHCEISDETRFNNCDELKLYECLVYESRLSGYSTTCFATETYFCGSEANDIMLYCSTGSDNKASKFRNTEFISQSSSFDNCLISASKIFRIAESSFEDCRFSDCDFGSNRMFGSSFEKSLVNDCKAAGAHFTKISFKDSILCFNSFENTEFKNTTFTNCNMFETSFENCSFEEVLIEDDKDNPETIFEKLFISNCTGEIEYHSTSSDKKYKIKMLQHASDEISDLQDFEISEDFS